MANTAPADTLPGSNVDDILGRIRNLEEAVFKEARHPNPSSGSREAELSVRDTNTSRNLPFPAWAPIELQVPAALRDQALQSDLAKHLPPREQGMEFFEHFVRCVQPTFAVLHIPSARTLVEQTYQATGQAGKETEPDNLLLVFSIFASAILTWTPQLLENIGTTPAVAHRVFDTYSGLAISLSESVSPSTVALEAISILVHVLTNAEGFGEQVHQLRNRAFLMARIMQIHRLDTAQSRKARRAQGDWDLVQVEQQRRVWWHMVANDWLLAFSAGAQEGTYIFHPRHMMVNHPCNIDDSLVTTVGERQLQHTQEQHQDQLFGFPITTATSMSYFLHRLYLADLCRQVVDTLPSVLLEPQDLDYDIVLMLDSKFQNLIKSLPTFFQLDPNSIQESLELCQARPYIAWQRATLHFSINTYTCRLHRPFHLEGTKNPKYAFSRITCVRSAHAVLELWHSMADLGDGVGLNPARFWTVAQHVFLAAITLAAEVSFDPGAPLAEVRKKEVLAACRLLEDLQHDSPMARDRIQKGVQALLATLQKSQQQQLPSTGRETDTSPLDDDNASMVYNRNKPNEQLLMGYQTTMQSGDSMSRGDGHGVSTPFVFTGNSSVSSSGFTGETMDDWSQLWGDFFNPDPGWDVPQWNSLLEDIDWTLGPTL